MKPIFLLLCHFLLIGSMAEACDRPIKVASRAVGWSLVLEKSGQVSGAIPDFMRLVEQNTGCHFIFEEIPLIRSYLYLKNGTLDLIPASIRNTERDEFAEFVAATRNPVLLISLQESPVKLRTLKALSDEQITVDVMRGTSYGEAYNTWLRDPKTRLHVSEVSNYDMIIQKLMAGRTQAVIAPMAAVAESIAQHSSAKQIHVEILADIPTAISGFSLSRKLSATDRQLLESSIRMLVRKGEYMRLIRKYYPAWAMTGITSAELLPPPLYK